MAVMEKNTEKEISSLRKAGRDREQDLETLNSVLQCNQDLINVRVQSSLPSEAEVLFHLSSQFQVHEVSGRPQT